jgi:hypothetical protein
VAGFIAKQPNGLYCRFSSVVDCPTHWNMTQEEYLQNVTGTVSSREEGEKILERYIQPFSRVVTDFVPTSMDQEAFEEIVKLMSLNSKGDTKVKRTLVVSCGEFEFKNFTEAITTLEDEYGYQGPAWDMVVASDDMDVLCEFLNDDAVDAELIDE